MPLKAMLETIDDLPDNIQEMYAEQDIKLGANTVKRFVLQVDGVQDHPQVKNLQTAHERQKELNRTIKVKVVVIKKLLTLSRASLKLSMAKKKKSSTIVSRRWRMLFVPARLMKA
jgi:hypothetical protein